MKIRRDVLERIVYEEFVRFLKENKLGEAQITTSDEDDLGVDDVLKQVDGTPSPEKAPEEPTGMPEFGSDVEEPGGQDPADDELSAEEADEDPEAAQGSIAQQLEGKSIASISMDEKSKMMPGAKEIVITFNEIEDALRILVTDSGQLKFFFRGLRNDLSTNDSESGGEPTSAPDKIDDVPEGDSVMAADTPHPAEDDDEEEEIEI